MIICFWLDHLPIMSERSLFEMSFLRFWRLVACMCICIRRCVMVCACYTIHIYMIIHACMICCIIFTVQVLCTRTFAATHGDIGSKWHCMPWISTRHQQVGARAGRLSRVLRFLRFLPFLAGGDKKDESQCGCLARLQLVMQYMNNCTY